MDSTELRQLIEVIIKVLEKHHEVHDSRQCKVCSAYQGLVWISEELR